MKSWKEQKKLQGQEGTSSPAVVQKELILLRNS